MNTTNSNAPDPAENTSPDRPDPTTPAHEEPALDDTRTSATTPADEPATTAPAATATGFFRRRWVAVTAIATVTVVLAAAGGVFITQKVQQDQLTAALASRQQAIHTATKLQKDDRTGRADYDTAHEMAVSLQSQVTKLHADAAAGGFLTPDQIEALQAEAAALNTATQHAPGTPVAPLPTVGGATAPIDRVKADTSNLQKHTSTEKKNHSTTLEATKKTTTQLEHTETLLTSFITGTPATDTTTAIPDLPTVAEPIAAAHPKAGEPATNEFIAAVTAAIDGITTAEAPAPLLQNYLDKAAALKAAHDQAAEQEALAAAQRDGADSYTDPGTGQTKTTPKNTRPNKTGGNGAGADGNAGNGNSNGGGGGGGSTGGGGSGSGGSSSRPDPTALNYTRKISGCEPGQYVVPFGPNRGSVPSVHLTIDYYWDGSDWIYSGTTCAW